MKDSNLAVGRLFVKEPKQYGFPMEKARCLSLPSWGALVWYWRQSQLLEDLVRSTTIALNINLLKAPTIG